MTKPNNFILTSDYASLKNDNKGTITLYIGDSGLLPYGQSKLYESFITLGTVNACHRGQISRTGSTDVWCDLEIVVPLTVTAYQNGTPLTSFEYGMPVALDRSSPTQIRLSGTFYSYGAGVDMRITGDYKTITADVVTFLSPFN